VFDVVPSPDYARDRTVYAATAAGVCRSRDGGATWQPSPTGPEPGVACAGIAGPHGGDGSWPVLAALTNGRLFESDDQGESWRSLGEHFLQLRLQLQAQLQPGADIVSVAVSPNYPRDRTLFVGTSTSSLGDAGEVVLWRSVDGGMHWQRWLVERGGDFLSVAVPPNYPVDEVVFVGLGGRVLKPLRQTREVRAGEQRPIWRGVQVGGEGTSVTALTTAPNAGAGATVFAGTSAGVYVSRDGGDRFSAWGDGLGPAAVVALAVSPSYARDRLVYALELGGAVWQRRDA
jgi:hypothetical protein